MDGIQTWSSFERRRRNDPAADADDDAPTAVGGFGIDALYVSASSPNVAPAAASLLRHSGFTAPGGRSGGGGPRTRRDGDDDEGLFDSRRRAEEEDEEFRLRFHWMRPHPSLAFALEGELAKSEGGDAKAEEEAGQRPPMKGRPKERIHPAIESAKMMEAYRSSQMRKSPAGAINGGGNDGDDHPSDDGKYFNEAEVESVSPPAESNGTACDLPLEPPKLRINLASLVQPPLMSSWLPEEDADSSYDSDNEGDGMDE